MKSYPTLVGCCALIFWALAAPFSVQIKSIPIFETLTLVFSVSFLLSAFKLTIYHQWSQLKQPWFLCIIGFIGIYGNNLLYISAFRYAPAAQVDLINYLWPVLVILFTGFLPNEKLTIRHVIAASMGFCAVYVLINQGERGFERQYLMGYLLAFLDALVWSVYTIVARHHGKSPVEMIGIYCGIGAVCSLFLHLQFETTQSLHYYQWMILLAMGMTTQCLAYFFWDFGVKQGDFKLLSILSYGTPMLSIGFLIIFGMATASIELSIACLLLMTGGLIGVMPWQMIFQRLLWWREPKSTPQTEESIINQLSLKDF